MQACQTFQTNMIYEQTNIWCESHIINMTIEGFVQYDKYRTYYIILHCSKIYIYCTYA